MSGPVSLREIFTYPARLHRIFYPKRQIGQSDERIREKRETPSNLQCTEAAVLALLLSMVRALHVLALVLLSIITLCPLLRR